MVDVSIRKFCPRIAFAGWIAIALGWRLVLSPAATFAAGVDFNFQIRPLLSDRCMACHGPDEKARKGKLRLDLAEGLFEPRTNGKRVVVKGSPKESELIRRIESTDPEELMPPPDSHLSLNADEKQILKSWIAEGGTWKQHWAFEPILGVIPPVARQTQWARNPIDHFILDRLEKAGLKPAPEADRERWLRRVTLDLTGLPPTVDEIDAFAKDGSVTAYSTVVDRLLKSDAFGERMTTDWMDVARYADTHGYQADRYRAVWPWRDWVIRSFNQNLPYNQFISWQIAGDLLPNATKDQRLATAFNRLHLQNEEGGIVEEEFRVAYVVDRVNTMGTAFLGLTFECSRCHDHKFDPISQRDFYSLSAFFQNIDEAGQTSYFVDMMPVPTLLLSSELEDQRLQQLGSRIGKLEVKLADRERNCATAFSQWWKEKGTNFGMSGKVAEFSFDDIKDGKLANSVDPNKPGKTSDDPKSIDGWRGKGVLLDGENGLVFPGVGHFGKADPFTISLAIKPERFAPRQVILHHSRAPVDAGSHGYELLLEDGRVAVGLHHMWPGNSLKVRTHSTVSTQDWTHVCFTYDGGGRAAGVTLYLDGRPVETEVIRDGLWRDIAYGGNEPDLAIGFRFRDSGFKGGGVDALQVFNRALNPLEALEISGRGSLQDLWTKPLEQLDADREKQLRVLYVRTLDPIGNQIRAELQRARHEQVQLVTSIPEIMVMHELPQPKKAFVLKRGAYDSPAESVQAATPGLLPKMHADWPRNRLGLANWLVSDSNPLTARVTVNRAWQLFFGRGLVETAENFGSQGTLPTHPELMDWIANAFLKGAPDIGLKPWDWKGLCRVIALSATYRQSSQATPESVSRDPENQMYSRVSARRLTAEMLRDQSLAVSGLLARHVGGASVKPYQPEGLWEEKTGGNRYDQGHGDDLHRRSLYTYFKRTIPHPAMSVFDAADRNNCSVRRQSTSTPLQPLALLNDIQAVEAARFLAGRMLSQGGESLSKQLIFGFRTVTSRPPSARELRVLEMLFEDQKKIFQSDPLAAARFLSVGESVVDGVENPIDLAAATIVAKTLLNHDEAILRR